MYDHPMIAQQMQYPPQVPPRVQAAQGFLHYTQSLTCRQPDPFGGSSEARDLTPKERAAYEAALAVMTSYFLGEMDYGDVAPVRQDPPDDEPKQPVPVPT